MPRCGARRRRSTATDRSRGTSSAWQGGSGTGSSIPRGRAGDAIADCGLPIAESIGERRGVRTRPANPQSTIRTPQFFRGSRTMTGPRTVRAARGPERSCKGWIQEAALRMLMNNLDPEVAERPQDLVVYGGTGKAARDWPSFDAICRTLVPLGAYETFGAVARRHFGGSLQGRVVLTGGLGGMGGAQPLAATLHGGVCLAVEVDPARVERRLATRYLDRSTASLDEALRWCDAAKRAGEALSVGLIGN